MRPTATVSASKSFPRVLLLASFGNPNLRPQSSSCADRPHGTAARLRPVWFTLGNETTLFTRGFKPKDPLWLSPFRYPTVFPFLNARDLPPEHVSFRPPPPCEGIPCGPSVGKSSIRFGENTEVLSPHCGSSPGQASPTETSPVIEVTY